MPFRLARFPSLVAEHHRASSPSPAPSPSMSALRSSGSSRTSILPAPRALLVLLTALAALVLSSSLVLRSLGSSSSNSGVPELQGRNGVCVSADQPNPLATTYPNNATGVFNATMVVVPIPLAKARAMVPAQWGILEGAYRALLPGFPEGMYPLFLQAGHDHDIQFVAFGLTIPDFSRLGFEFPFLDLLGDGATPFRWTPHQLISATNAAALDGARSYGQQADAAVFDPPCDAFGRSAAGGAMHFSARTPGAAAVFAELDFAAVPSSPFPLAFYRNVTNQPSFGDGSVCDNQIRLFDTELSKGGFAPVPVRGSVVGSLPPWKGREVLADVYGLQVATPFIENNYLACESLRGYSGVDIPGY